MRAELAVAEVGVLGQGLLVRWERWVEPPVWPVGLWVWVFLGDAVDGPVGKSVCELVVLGIQTQRALGSSLPFTCEHDCAFLDRDAAVHIILLCLMWHT